MAEPPVQAAFVEGFDALPEAARALFGADAFSTLGWYRSIASAGMPAGSRAGAVIVRRGGDVLAAVPASHNGPGFSALTTPYTVRWAPLLRDGLAAPEIAAIGAACARLWRRWPLTRLDAIDASAPWLTPFLSGVRTAWLVPLPFDHFGNWHENVAGLDWEKYLARRPGALRSTIARRGKRFSDPEAFSLVNGPDQLGEALAAYERVYAASWKQPEPYPAFNPMLMRAAAADGSLRLGVLRLQGEPVAAQFWLVNRSRGQGGWAGVQKLAHDERHRSLAPGTVLTALMLRHLLDREQIEEIDFGRGDDAYKRDWAGQRRQHIGVVLAAPWHPHGLAAIARHAAGGLAGWRKAVR